MSSPPVAFDAGVVGGGGWLTSLPDDCLAEVLASFSTYDVLTHLEHGAPCKAWRSLWHQVASVEIDLERDVAAASSAGLMEAGDPNTARPDVRVSEVIAARRPTYTHLVRLVRRHARDLQSLALDHFGAALSDRVTDEVDTAAVAAAAPPPNGTATDPPPPSSGSFDFHDLLSSHAHSLVSLSLVASDVARVRLGPEFLSLESLDLRQCRLLSDPLVLAPALTSLDLSRTLLNDLEVVRMIATLPRLRVLRLIACKNIRMLALPSATAAGDLFRDHLPDLRILDLSSTGVVDACVNGLAAHCPRLEALFLNDCRELRTPRIISRTLRTFGMRQCRRLRVGLRVEGPELREVDLSKTNLRDAMVSSDAPRGGGIYTPNVEVLDLRGCDELVRPRFCNAAPNANSSAATLNPEGYPRLHTLDLSHCYGLDNIALFRLLEASPSLTALDMRECKAVQAEWRETDEGVAADRDGGVDGASFVRRDVFPSNLSRLRDLRLNGCAVTDESLRLLLATPTGAVLERLDMHKCLLVTGVDLVAPRLRELDLSRTRVDDVALETLLREDHCPQLRTLRLERCDRLVSPTVHHARLQLLDASECVGLREIRVEAPCLRRFDAARNLALVAADFVACPRLVEIDLQHSAQCAVRRADASSGEATLVLPAEARPSSSMAKLPDLSRVEHAPVLPARVFSEAAYQEFLDARRMESAASLPSVPTAASASAPAPSSSSSVGGSPPRSGFFGSSPPRSPLRRAASPPRPIGGVVSMNSSPSRLRRSLPSHAVRTPPISPSMVRRDGAVAAAAASSSSEPFVGDDSSSSNASSPLRGALACRGIRSVDLCVTEARVVELESRLAAAESDRVLQAGAVAAAAPGVAREQAESELADAKALCYGLKKQLAVQKAKLRQEQRQIALARAREEEEAESTEA